jgi:hypothetical protein
MKNICTLALQKKMSTQNTSYNFENTPTQFCHKNFEPLLIYYILLRGACRYVLTEYLSSVGPI